MFISVLFQLRGQYYY